MDIFLYNSLKRQKEKFSPIKEGSVGMYNCGPTVYNYAHIGNLRQYIFSDVLRRTLEINGYIVKQIINITDVGHLASDGDDGEDKMTRALIREGKPLTMEAMKEIGSFYTSAFINDLKLLNIQMPAILPKASEHIADDLRLIEVLDEKGFVYKTSDGLYFDTSLDKNYGRLGLAPIDEDRSRIGINSEKRNARDFALWKFNDSLGWESKYGKGFPGWHIECSGMAIKYLGESFDIHTGGIDHIPVHHNNEIAQSENATGKQFANYWLHGEHLNIGGEKIAKSVGNTVYVKDISDKGINPLAYRHLVLMAHYRTRMNFTWEALSGAESALNRLYNLYDELGEETGDVIPEYKEIFLKYLNDDLDTSRALTVLWDTLKSGKYGNSDKKATVIFFDKVLALGFTTREKEAVPTHIQSLLDERERARASKDFAKSDALRDKISELGYDIIDLPSSYKIRKK